MKDVAPHPDPARPPASRPTGPAGGIALCVAVGTAPDRSATDGPGAGDDG